MIFTFKGRLLAGLGAAGGILLVFWVLFYLPLTARVEEIDAQASQENVKARQLEQKKIELAEVKGRYQQLTDKLAQAEIAPLTEKGLSVFLHELGLRGEIYGISFLSLSPKSTISGKYYDSIPVEIALYGTYFSFAMLLSDLAEQQKEIPFTIDNVNIISLEGQGISRLGGSSFYSLRADLTVSLYLYKESDLASYKSPEEMLRESVEKEKGEEKKLPAKRG